VSGRLQGRVALVTGGAGGIGAAMVRLFAAEGARVLSVDIVDEAAGEASVADLGDVAYLCADVSEESEVEAAARTCVERWGRLDVLCNNAGLGVGNDSILDITVEEWDRVQAVNLRGVFLGIKHAGRIMRDQGSGSIINTSSVAAIRAGLSAHGYSTAKAGVIHLTRSAAVELGEYGVRVNAILPGTFATGIYLRHVPEELATTAMDYLRSAAEYSQPLARLGDPIEIAYAALFFASDESTLVTAQALTIDGGMTAGNKWSRLQGNGFGAALRAAGHQEQRP